jgi:hypothetical protein
MPTNRGYTNFDDQEVGIINTDISNQMAFKPGSKKDITLKSLYEMKDTYKDTPAYKQLREKDVEQFNKGKEPLSLPANEYKGIKGYTANANNIARDFTFDTKAPQQSIFERGKDLASSGIGKVGKVGMDAFNLIKNNNPIGLLTSGFGKLGDMFEYKGGDVTVDENGNIISAADLNKMNARGGYYTDAARNARNRTKSLAAFRAREATDSKRYKDLLLQEIKQTKARAEAKAKAAAQLRAANTGYTSRGTKIDYGDYYQSDGVTANTSSSMANNPSQSYGGPRAKGGLIGYQNGGLATMFRQKR